MDEAPFTVEFTAEQRALLLEIAGRYFDEYLVRLVSLMVQRGEKYELRADAVDLEELANELAITADEEEDPDRSEKIDSLIDCIDEQAPGVVARAADFSEHSHNTGDVFLMRTELPDGDVWRTIAIRGGQTLHDLHEAIFEAFERFEEHLYSFYLPPTKVKTLNLRKLRDCTEYTHPFNLEEQGDRGPKFCNAATTSIESLELKPGQTLFYLFDFGDEWWHRITLEKIEAPQEDEEYPQIVESAGEAPPQYEAEPEEDWEENEEWDEEDEEWEEDYEEEEGDGEFDFDDEEQ